MDAQNPSSLSISTIGDELTIIGNVTSKGELHVNGQLQGDVHCVALVVGKNAKVEGNVVAEDVLIGGRLIGSIRALTVTLQANSHVEGYVFHNSLSLEQGSHFEGDSRPSDDPLSIPEAHTAEPQRDNKVSEITSEQLNQIAPRVAQCLGMFLIA